MNYLMTLVTDEFACQLNDSIELYSILEEIYTSDPIEEGSKQYGLHRGFKWYEADFIVENDTINAMYRVYRANFGDLENNDNNTRTLFKKFLRKQLPNLRINVQDIITGKAQSKIKIFFGDDSKSKTDRSDYIKSQLKPYEKFNVRILNFSSE